MLSLFASPMQLPISPFLDTSLPPLNVVQMPHLYNGTDCISEVARADFQDYDRMVYPLPWSSRLEQQNSLIYLMLLSLSSPLLGSQTMHPTPKCCTLMCGLGFRLFEGDNLRLCSSACFRQPNLLFSSGAFGERPCVLPLGSYRGRNATAAWQRMERRMVSLNMSHLNGLSRNKEARLERGDPEPYAIYCCSPTPHS